MSETFPRRVVAKRRLGLGCWLWLTAGLALIGAAAFFREWEFAWLAVWPLANALFLKVFEEPRLELQLSQSSFSLNAGPPIAYDSILRVRALTAGDTPAAASAFRISVRHAAGHILIPAQLDCPSPDLLAFLQARAPAFVLQLDSRLHEYLQKQEQRYGNLVSIYVGEHAPPETRSWGLAKAILATALFCTVAGFAGYASPLGNDGALILGVISSVVLVATAVLSLVSYSRSPGNRQVEAGLIVSPGGLAMIQGELAGELQWEEIRQIKLSSGPTYWGHDNRSRGACIQLFVAGATISIADVYHQPLNQIYASILKLRALER